MNLAVFLKVPHGLGTMATIFIVVLAVDELMYYLVHCVFTL